MARADILKIPGTDPSTFYIGLSIVTNGNPGTVLLILHFPCTDPFPRYMLFHLSEFKNKLVFDFYGWTVSLSIIAENFI